MAKTNYQFEKRQRDLAKKRKQEEKRQRKLAAKVPGEGGTDTLPDGTESETTDAAGESPERASTPSADTR